MRFNDIFILQVKKLFIFSWQIMTEYICYIAKGQMKQWI